MLRPAPLDSNPDAGTGLLPLAANTLETPPAARQILKWRRDMNEDKRCGTCRWWQKGVIHLGDCECPLPDTDGWPYSVSRHRMLKDEGRNCPCWEKRTDENGKQ